MGLKFPTSTTELTGSLLKRVVSTGWSRCFECLFLTSTTVFSQLAMITVEPASVSFRSSWFDAALCNGWWVINFYLKIENWCVAKTESWICFAPDCYSLLELSYWSVGSQTELKTPRMIWIAVYNLSQAIERFTIFRAQSPEVPKDQRWAQWWSSL